MLTTVNRNTLLNMCNWALDNGEVPMIYSPPGEGKSDLMRQLANCRNTTLTNNGIEKLYPLLVTITNHQAEDFAGLAIKTQINGVDKAAYIPFDFLPVDTDPIPAGYDGWLLIFDELAAGKGAVQVAAQMVILERKVGNKNLHPNVRIICAGNRKEDKANSTTLSWALASRLIHFEYKLDALEWCDWATENNLDYRIISFIEYNHDNLRNFNPDMEDKTFACPRTYHKLSKLIQPWDDLNEIYPLIEGTIGETMATQFSVFAKHFMDLPSINDVISNPTTCKIPRDKVKQFAMVKTCINKTSIENIGQIIEYIQRYSAELITIYAKSVKRKDESLIIQSDKFRDLIMYQVQGL